MTDEPLSECCGAENATNGDASASDYGLCPECGEHAIFTTED